MFCNQATTLFSTHCNSTCWAGKQLKVAELCCEKSFLGKVAMDGNHKYVGYTSEQRFVETADAALWAGIWSCVISNTPGPKIVMQTDDRMDLFFHTAISDRLSNQKLGKLASYGFQRKLTRTVRPDPVTYYPERFFNRFCFLECSWEFPLQIAAMCTILLNAVEFPTCGSVSASFEFKYISDLCRCVRPTVAIRLAAWWLLPDEVRFFLGTCFNIRSVQQLGNIWTWIQEIWGWCWCSYDLSTGQAA